MSDSESESTMRISFALVAVLASTASHAVAVAPRAIGTRPQLLLASRVVIGPGVPFTATVDLPTDVEALTWKRRSLTRRTMS